MELTKRKLKILSSVVFNYIQGGEPVGSKLVAEEIGVSSATVRNEMADLTFLGLLQQTHTSSGRIPSHNGYREYVKHVDKYTLLASEKQRIDAFLLDGAYDAGRLLQGAHKALSEITRCVAAVSSPDSGDAMLRAVQFVQTGRRTAMLILMLSSGEVYNRMFHCDFDLSSEIIQLFFRAFNEKLIGRRASEITIAFIQTLGASLGEISILASSAFVALYEAAQLAAHVDVLVSGQTNLLFYSDLTTEETSGILRFFETENEILDYMTKRKRKGVTVLIGAECERPEMRNCSFIYAPYQIDRTEVGFIAVLGPVRMDYQINIPALRYVAESVSAMLTELMQEE